MKTLLAVLVVLVSFAVSARAEWRGDWSALDISLLALNGALGGYDWGHTQWAVGHDGAMEHNPNLGEHPSRARIDQHFALAGTALLGVGLSMPKGLRTPFLLTVATIQIANLQGALYGGRRLDYNAKARGTGLKGAAAGALTVFALAYKW